MQNNYFNTNQYPCMYPQQNPNAVSINIISPQAFGAPCPTSAPINPNGFYSLYGQNPANAAMYPQNYNNLGMHQGMIPGYYAAQNPNSQNANDLNNRTNMAYATNLVQKTDVPSEQEASSTTKTKRVIPLTDQYIMSLENYMNNENPKIRLIGAKEVMERFKEDENRKDNPSLMALLNKALRDTSPTVRFLGLTTLQLGYAVGNNETVTILKDIQATNKDKFGEDSLLASEILLNMAGGEQVEVPMTQAEIEKQAQKASKDGAK